MNVTGYIHSLRWGNPYTDPSDGLPRILIKIETESPKLTTEIKTQLLNAYPGWQPGCGYSFALDFIYEYKPWSIERKAKARRTRTINKINKNYPLFADEFIAEAFPEDS